MNHQANHLKQHIGYWLSRMRYYVHQSFEERLIAHGVTVASWRIMVSIYDGQADSINTLACYIEIDKATISRTVTKMVASGLLSHRLGKDKRSGLVVLTAKGKKLVPKLIAEAEANEQQFFGHLSAAETAQLQKAIKKIIVNIPSIKIEGWLNSRVGVNK